MQSWALIGASKVILLKLIDPKAPATVRQPIDGAIGRPIQLALLDNGWKSNLADFGDGRRYVREELVFFFLQERNMMCTRN